MAFEDIIRQIGEEADRTAVADLAKKYPVLKNFAELGEKASAAQPHLDQINTLNKRTDIDLPRALKLAADWESWKSEHWDGQSGSTKAEKQAKDALASAQARIAELEAGVSIEGEMTIEEVNQALDKKLSDMGVVTKSDIPKLLPMDRLVDKEGKPIVATREDLDRYTNGIAGRFEEIYAALTPEMVTHHQMFGEPIDVNKVLGVMKTFFDENKRPMKASDAYKEAYREKFVERDKQHRQKEIEDAEKRGADKKALELQQSSGGRAIPLDSRGSIVSGPVMKRWQDKVKAAAEANKGSANGKLGSGHVTAEATRRYYEQQNSGSAA